MRARRTLLIAALVVAGAACDGDEATDPDNGAITTRPTTTQPAPSEPATTQPAPSEPATAQPAPSEPATTQPATTPPAPATSEPTMVDVRLYFLRGERLVIHRHQVEGPAVLRGALEQLLAGPDSDLHTAIPDGTELRGVNLEEGTATVDLSGGFATGGGSLSMFARVAQVVFTATQFDNVDRVVFWIDGRPVDALGGDGLAMRGPWERMDVPRDLTGGVLVETPQPGDTVTSPFVVTGEADVFEGDFPIEIRRGDDVLSVIAPVTGGALGDWADFTTTVTVDAIPGAIELVAYDAGGCGDGPECPPIVETVVPLTLG